ncbi:T9SS type A sorting domain-containing protein [Adhaeribacter terreus]|uniref:T9SS type A sorting domain-containing protein n=1 Tax=Adhaeribacter terreus TaxID=529703 RepID=A0ABW0E963_9BACT
MPLKIFTRLSFFLFLYSVSANIFAQGSWQPSAADLSFPRTLMKASEIPGVKQSLQDPARLEIYTSVYNWAMVTPPASNTTDTERRLRARSAKNAAFVRIMNLKPSANNTLDTLTAPERAQLETNIIALLNSLNTAADPFWSYEKWQWRSKELIDYLIAYDLLRGAGVPETNLSTAKNQLQQFAGNLYKNGSGFVGNINNNHLFMTAAALGMSGIVLNDMNSANAWQQPLNWISIGIYNIDNAMWRNAARQSEPGIVAGYAEGPYYFKYAMENCLPFFRAFGNFLPDSTYSFTWNGSTRQIRNPYFDPNYDLLYQWMTDIAMPDGRLPALEDSYIDMAMPELALTGKPQFVKDFYPQNMEPAQLKSLNQQLDGTVDLRANYLAANINPAPQTEKTLTSFPEAGNLVFRSGSGFTGNYLHLYGKNGRALSNSGGHNHGDASSFILYSQGQLLALDAGYLNYNRRAEVGNASNHNLILVDGNGPQIGTSGAPNDAEAFIENTFETQALGYGEVRTTYSGANITRKTINVRGEYYLMADFISAAAPHNFTWQLHGFGLENGAAAQGTFTENAANHEGTWQKNGVSLKAHVTASGGATTYSKTASAHEITYNQAQDHTAFLVQKDNVSATQFLAALQPYTVSTAATSTLSLPNMAGLTNVSAGFTDIAFTQADTVLQTVTTNILPEPVKADANFTLFSVDNAGAFAQLFLQNGTTLFYGTEKIIESSRRANITWSQNAPNEFQGYVNKAATLNVSVAQQPNSVSGQNLTSWTYDATNQTLQATFSQPSDFQYKVAPAPLPVEMVGFWAEKVNNKVKLSWQTASEKNSKLFRVQRSADARNWKTIGEKTAQGHSSSLTTYEYIDLPDFSGLVYYRLAQEDLDGTLSFSAVKVVAFEKPISGTLQLYPNPAAQQLFLKLETLETETAQIRISDLAGREVLNTKKQLQAGENKVSCGIEKLPAGFYVLSVQTKNQTQQARFVKR